MCFICTCNFFFKNYIGRSHIAGELISAYLPAVIFHSPDFSIIILEYLLYWMILLNAVNSFSNFLCQLLCDYKYFFKT